MFFLMYLLMSFMTKYNDIVKNPKYSLELIGLIFFFFSIYRITDYILTGGLWLAKYEIIIFGLPLIVITFYIGFVELYQFDYKRHYENKLKLPKWLRSFFH